MPAIDYMLPVDGKQIWITIYADDRTLCGYYCPKLAPDGVHTCKVFGTVLETLEKPSVDNHGNPNTVIIAHRCEKCLNASTFAERW